MTVVDGRRDSINAEMGKINNARARGLTLSPVEIADEAIILELNAWEAEMVTVREAAKSARLHPAQIDWPLPPASITWDWLDGF